jgi:hypothetical protein
MRVTIFVNKVTYSFDTDERGWQSFQDRLTAWYKDDKKVFFRLYLAGGVVVIPKTAPIHVEASSLGEDNNA